ncbi:hypothetical protein GIB67_033895 [Kingdonia uniflora]|uniref:Uncharacterized protein n=1 Tax=Kingdonia uniflora TaxID=39325 RepID=A0A7J7NBP1_9MAGN|nr:hypothetical protein GIB67_033895 [Kingdonia uniflora]
MGWFQSLISPVRMLWIRLHFTHIKSKNLSSFYFSFISCPYEDVHVLWFILVESHTHSLPSKT